MESLAAAGRRRVLVMTGKRSAKVTDVETTFAAAGRVVRSMAGLPSGSPVSSVLESLATIRSFRPDVVVAVGGGSVIDIAKAACTLSGSDEPFSEPDVVARWTVWPARVPARPIQLIAIPTTAGTGTEATPYSVLSDLNNRKLFGVSEHFRPDLAALVPEFVETVPREVIADLAMDALSHALEAIWSRRATPSSDLAASAALALLHDGLIRHYDKPADRHAACAVLLAATEAGEAFRLASSTACHALSFPLASSLNVSHGYACSLSLAVIARLNLGDPATRAKLTGPSGLLGLARADDVPLYIDDLRDRLGLRRPHAVSSAVVARAFALALPAMMENNPVSIASRDVSDLAQRVAVQS
jgi:alcohol dehydrogenase class IV